MNFLHEIEPGTEDVMHAIIEIPRHCKNKYEIDKKTGIIALDRALHTAQDYPVDYGFVPKTWWDDDDALDVIVITTYPLYPGVLVRVRPVGIMHVTDSGDSDDKIVGVPKDDPRFDKIKEIEDINPHTIREITHFLETYKTLQNKKVKVDGIEGVEAAKAAFRRSIELYKKKFS